MAGADLDPDAAAAADRAIAEAAERSELSTHLTCADCGAEWTETLDVPAFVWAEVEAAAVGLLTDVAELAAAYGWAERDILAMSPARRSAYLARARMP
jgi:nucleotide-binding universal stress UspA family protein